MDYQTALVDACKSVTPLAIFRDMPALRGSFMGGMRELPAPT